MQPVQCDRMFRRAIAQFHAVASSIGWSGKKKRRHKAEKNSQWEGVLFLRLYSLLPVTRVLLQDKTLCLYYWVDCCIMLSVAA